LALAGETIGGNSGKTPMLVWLEARGGLLAGSEAQPQKISTCEAAIAAS